MNNEDEYIVEVKNETLTNGWVNHKETAMYPIGIKTVYYNNPKTGQRQSQSYFILQDFVAPVILKKDKETGELYFGMIYEEVPSSIHGVQVNIPDCPFFEEKKMNILMEILQNV